MRTLYKGLFLATLMIMIWSGGEILISSGLFLDQPRIHVVKEGEYFSKLALQYYGNADYWHALAVINRAPDVDKLYPGEEIILPSIGALTKIARTTYLSKVNNIVNEQMQVAQVEDAQSAQEFAARQSQTSEKAGDGAGSGNQMTDEKSTSDQTAEQPAPGIITSGDSENTDAGTPNAMLENPQTEQPAMIPEDDYQSPTQEATGHTWIWILAFAAGAVLLIGGYLFFRKKDQDDDEDFEIKATPVNAFSTPRNNGDSGKMKEHTLSSRFPQSDENRRERKDSKEVVV